MAVRAPVGGRLREETGQIRGTTLKDLAETLPDAVYLELPKTGHYLNIEEPEAFTEAVVRFIQEHPPRR